MGRRASRYDFWDADQNGGNSPWGFRNGIGITAADVTFNQTPGSAPPYSSILDVAFAPGTMVSGDSFTFDFDTDNTITDGDEFGEFGVTVQLRLSDGSVFDTAFFDDGIGIKHRVPRTLLPFPSRLRER